MLPPDPTLDEMRAALAPLIPAQAAFDGWGETALARAADELGIDAGHARLAFPGGRIEMIDAWFAWIDAAMTTALTADQLAAMKFRDRIRALIIVRLDLALPHREAARRALAILAMPQNLATGARLAWRAADAMWRLAGDTATDFNHYTKRATLAGVYSVTLLTWLDDDSEGQAATKAFLGRRLDGVMRFEKLKGQLTGDPARRPSLARFLGRLRYPVV